MQVKVGVLFILTGLLKSVCSGDDFAMTVEGVAVENADTSENKDRVLENDELSLLENEILSRKQSFYGESYLDSSGYPTNFSENYLRENNNFKEIERKGFNGHQEGLHYNRDGNIISHNRGLENVQNLERLGTIHTPKGHQSAKTNYDWGRRNNIFEENIPLSVGNKHIIYLHPLPVALKKHWGMEKCNSFAVNNELPSKKYSRYYMNKMIHDSNSDTFGNYKVYSTDVPLIINIKTKCPLHKLSKNRIMHKFGFIPKSHLKTQNYLFK